MKKILSLIALVFGVSAFIIGNYISNEVIEGEQKIAQAEENTKEQKRPVLGPIRRNARNQATDNAREKINEKEKKIAGSEITANWLRGTGIILFVVGIGFLIFNYCQTKRK